MSPATADVGGRRFAHEDVDVANTLLKMQQSSAAAAVEHAVRQQQHAFMQAGMYLITHPVSSPYSLPLKLGEAPYSYGE